MKHVGEYAMIVVDKTQRTLSLVDCGALVAVVPVLVGKNGGHKQQEGDMRTPEGRSFVLRLLPDEEAVGEGYYKGLHISYPDIADAVRGLSTGLIDEPTCRQIIEDCKQGNIPPQESALGGFVAIHAGLADDEKFERGTLGCVVMRNRDMDEVYAFAKAGMPILIYP